MVCGASAASVAAAQADNWLSHDRQVESRALRQACATNAPGGTSCNRDATSSCQPPPRQLLPLPWPVINCSKLHQMPSTTADARMCTCQASPSAVEPSCPTRIPRAALLQRAPGQRAGYVVLRGTSATRKEEQVQYSDPLRPSADSALVRLTSSSAAIPQGC